MPFCGNCGASVEAKFCPQCGTQVAPHLAVTTDGGVAAVVAPVESDLPDQQRTADGRQAPETGPAVRDRYRAPSAQRAGDTIGDTERGAHTDTVHQVLGGSRERIAYRLSPSPMRIVGLAIKYAVGWILLSMINLTLGALLLMAGLIHVGWRFLGNRSIEYRISSERLEVQAGVLSSSTHTIELLDVADAHINQGLMGKLFGYSELTLTLDSKKYRAQNGIARAQYLHALPTDNIREVRDFIREAGMQDASRMDRLRLR